MEWKFKNAVLGSYEIENAINIDPLYLNEVSKWFRYVDTSICYNNDLYLKPLLKENRRIKVISKIPPQMTDDYEFMLSNHLRCLGRRRIDIMLIHNPRSNWDRIASLLENDDRIKEVGVSNFSISDLNHYKELNGHYPKYNEIEINPEFYDKELIEFCHSNDIKLIAYAILGGKYNARRNISRYTHPYLLNFAGYNAEFLILRSDNPNRLRWMSVYLNNIQKNVNDTHDTKVFERSSSNNKSIMPTSYSVPEIYTRGVFPTNSDQLYFNNNLVFSKGYTTDGLELKDDLELNKMKLPRYEFVSDYRVYIRYKIDEIIHNKTGKYPRGIYIHPSTYVAILRNGWFRKLRKKDNIRLSIVSSLCLITDTGRLSKVDDGKCKFMIESEIINNN